MKSDEEIREIIRKNVMNLRIDAGLTQEEFGKPFGKSKTAVASWEQGKSAPDIMTLYRLSAYYHKTLDYMYGEESKRKVKKDEDRTTTIRNVSDSKKN